MPINEPDLFEQLAKATTSTALAALIPFIEQKRNEVQHTLEKIEKAYEEAIIEGPGARDKMETEIQQVRKQFSDLGAASRVYSRRLQEFRDREILADVEATAKEAMTDAQAMPAIGLEFFNLLERAVDISQQYKLKSQRVTNVVQRSHKAGRPDLKPPLDPIRLAFIKRQQVHPIEDPALIKALIVAASQKNLLKKLGVEI